MLACWHVCVQDDNDDEVPESQTYDVSLVSGLLGTPNTN